MTQQEQLHSSEHTKVRVRVLVLGAGGRRTGERDERQVTPLQPATLPSLFGSFAARTFESMRALIIIIIEPSASCYMLDQSFIHSLARSLRQLSKVRGSE